MKRRLEDADVEGYLQECRLRYVPLINVFPNLEDLGYMLASKSLVTLVRYWTRDVDIEEVDSRLLGLLMSIGSRSGRSDASTLEQLKISLYEFENENEKALCAIAHLKQAADLMSYETNYFYRSPYRKLVDSIETLSPSPHTELEEIELMHSMLTYSVSEAKKGKFSSERWALRTVWPNMHVSSDDILNKSLFPQPWILMQELLGFAGIDTDTRTIKFGMRQILQESGLRSTRDFSS